MAEKQKKKREPLKERNPYKYYRNSYYACQGGEWACITAPFIAIFAAKWNEYFVFTESNSEGIKVTIGCVLAAVMAAFFAYRKIRHQEKANGKVTMLSYAIGVGVAFAFSYLFKVIIDDLFLILGCEFAGASAAYVVDFATVYNKDRMKVYKDAIDKLDAEEAAQKVIEERKKRRKGTYV